MPVLRSISASQSSCRLLCHSNIRSCSLMCLVLSQHHAALALSCALLCLSITLLLLSHVPCFVSASRYSCSLMYLALSQHHAALAQVLRLSITPLMCLALSQHDITPLFSALPFPLDIFPGYCSTLLQSCPMN